MICKTKNHIHFEYTGNMAWYACGSSKDEIPYVSYTSSWLAPSNRNYPNRTCYQIAYDANGNRRCDENRRIAWIKYNSLNLPYKVQGMDGNKTEYIYYATGEKIRAIETVPMNPMQIPLGATGTESTNIKTTNKTDYCTNFHYYNGALKYILTPDGYIEASNASKSNWRHVYSVKDYQGNVRGELLSATLATPAATTYSLRNVVNYYAFGLRENSYSGALFQYGGNEQSKDRDNSFDFNFRRLDPQLCRFTTQDPLAEMNFSISPYAYCSNDPINRIDPLGLYDIPEVTVIGKRPEPEETSSSEDYVYFAIPFDFIPSVFKVIEPFPFVSAEAREKRIREEEEKRKSRKMEMTMLENSMRGTMDILNSSIGFASIGATIKGGYLRSNELWHISKNKNLHFIGGKYWNNNLVEKSRAKIAERGSVFRSAGTKLSYASIAVTTGDALLSGEFKASQGINVAMAALAIGVPGIGSIVSGIYFVADFGLNLITGQGIGDRIDAAIGTLELYEGFY